jgi:nucleoside-diphosphate-sugar epimerase
MSMNEVLPQHIEAAIAEESRRIEGRYGAGNRRVLIIGGSGYIGVPLTHHLLGAGFKVRNLDLNLYGNAGAMTGFLLSPDYEFQHGDMASADDLDKALKDVTDVVVLAGLVGDPITKKYPAESGQVNDTGMINCLEALDGRGLNKVILVSTCSNYGLAEGDNIVNEESALNPLSLYAKSKVRAEKHLLGKKGKVDYHPVILRFATAFGLAPRMRFDLTVNEFTRELYLNRDLLVFDAKTWRPYCHVRDFSRLIRRVLDFPVAEVAFEVFNAGGDKNNHTKQGIVDLVLARLPGRKVSYKEQGSDPRNYRVSFEKVKSRLFFTPVYDVGYGIDEIISALRSGLLDDVESRRNFHGNYELTYPVQKRA